MLRLYNTKKYRVIPVERGSYDKTMEGVYDLDTQGVYDKETERVIEKYPWDPENFETPGELHDFLAEYLGFEVEPEGYQHPFTWDWAKDAPEEVLAAFPA